jgi:hypothetical protein
MKPCVTKSYLRQTDLYGSISYELVVLSVIIELAVAVTIDNAEETKTDLL